MSWIAIKDGGMSWIASGVQRALRGRLTDDWQFEGIRRGYLMSGLRVAFAAVLSVCVLAVIVPAEAGAYATIGAPPTPSTTSGLPDGRVYEQVSPANKHGYNAGADRLSRGETGVKLFSAFASPDGDAISFGAGGPVADTDTSGLNSIFVAERTAQGWVSRPAMARGYRQSENQAGGFSQNPAWLDFTPDLSHLAYAIEGADVPGAPMYSSANLYLSGSDPVEEPAWLSDPQIGGSLEEQFPGASLLGISPDASVAYFAFEGQLLPEDSSRSGWGLYEYRDGTLSEAGVLPDGSVPSGGALPAAMASSAFESYVVGENNPASQDNEVSADGTRMFFVASGELYVHEITTDGSERSVLVSASQLPGHTGEAAPDGVLLFADRTKNSGKEGEAESGPTYAYASSDGSHVFFESEDQLTSQAPSGPGAKVYDFDVDSGSLEYLPGVALGGIVTAASDGSSFVFVNDASSPEELDLWSVGSGGGSVSQIVQLPEGGFVGPARMAADDSVLVFTASAPIAGFNNAGTEQIYRYDIDADELSCLSCPPAGVQPSGNAYLSAIDQYQNSFFFNIGGTRDVNDVRGVSGDGTRVFFESPDALVSRDTNGQDDTYEWENGTVFLISSGTSSEYSLFLDNSESGDDVFFTTSEELVQGDDDGAFDVYDARVPRPGDNPPPASLPCQGDACQGPPSVPNLLGAPPSATFSGLGNAVAPKAVKTKSAPKQGKRRASKAKTLRSALRACHRRSSKGKQVTCEKHARKRHAAAAAIVKHNGRRGK
ncbi:MAG TPA: hypothetical protein VGF95_11850 [Solirubrobacteraceae bacterium]